MKLVLFILLAANLAQAKTWKEEQAALTSYNLRDQKIATLACGKRSRTYLEDECETLKHFIALDKAATQIETSAEALIRADFDRTHKKDYFDGMSSAQAYLNCNDIRNGLSKSRCSVGGGNDGYNVDMKIEVQSTAPFEYRVIYDRSSSMKPSN